MNRDDCLFLTLECRTCGTRYVFWKNISLAEVDEYILDKGHCRPRCKLKGEIS